MSNNKDEIKNSYYGTKLSFWAAKAFLALTTFIAAYTASLHIIESMTGYRYVIGGLVGAALITRFVDGTLDNGMNYILGKSSAPVYKWAVVVVMSIVTGGATWFSASIISDVGSDYVDAAEQAEMIENAVTENEKNLSRLSADIDRKKKEIELLQSQYDQDTTAVLSSMNSYHARYWRSGKWKAYYGKKKYPSLTASMDKILKIDTMYQKRLGALYVDLKDLDSGYIAASSKDVSGIIAKTALLENERQESQKSNISTFIKCLDVIGILILWLLFLDIRQMVKHDKMSLDGTRIDFTRWAMDRLAKMKGRALTTETKLDDAFVDMLTMIVNIIAAIFSVFSWLARVISFVILTPVRMAGEKFAPPSYQNIYTSEKKAVNSDISPARAIGFHQSGKSGERHPVNAGEIMQKLAGEQVANKGGESASKAGATRLSGSEQASSEQVERKGGERPEKATGEQVVNKGGERVSVKVVNGEPTFPHYSEKTGELMFYTRNEVKRFESKYRSAVNKIKEWIKANQSTAKSEKVLSKKRQLQSKIEKHKYWLAGLNAIDKARNKS